MRHRRRLPAPLNPPNCPPPRSPRPPALGSQSLPPSPVPLRAPSSFIQMLHALSSLSLSHNFLPPFPSLRSSHPKLFISHESTPAPKPSLHLLPPVPHSLPPRPSHPLHSLKPALLSALLVIRSAWTPALVSPWLRPPLSLRMPSLPTLSLLHSRPSTLPSRHSDAVRSLPDSCSPHVLIPGVARWTYIYFLAAAIPVAARILAHAKLIYEDLAIQTIPIFHTARTIDPSAAAGVACRLTREARRLLNRRIPTAVPMSVRVSLASSLQSHAHSITQGLARPPSHVPAASPPSNAVQTSAAVPFLPSSTPSRLKTAAHAPPQAAPPRPTPAFPKNATASHDPDAELPPPSSSAQTHPPPVDGVCFHSHIASSARPTAPPLCPTSPLRSCLPCNTPSPSPRRLHKPPPLISDSMCLFRFSFSITAQYATKTSTLFLSPAPSASLSSW